MNKRNEPNISILIQACKDGNRAGQVKLYDMFYSYGMSVSIRYAKDREEAKEVLNDSYLKAFAKIDQFDQNQSFYAWFRVIIIHTAIDYHRKNKRFRNMVELDEVHFSGVAENEAWENLLYEDVVKQVQKLPPAYRTVFNLYIIEGYKHHEIAEKLNVSVGTSKSNLSKARRKLQEQLKKKLTHKSIKHGQ